MKYRLMSLAAAGVLATSVMAYAGAKWISPVYIIKNTDGSGSMGGDLGSTRNTADTVQRFGCYYENFPPAWGSYKYASCYGYDGTKGLSCGTTDPALTDTISRITGDGYLWVQVDASGNCTRVQIGAQSFTPPKAP
ncbi:MAG TPA: hypothetical protein VH165_22805 [Kofleriaceae bacterium]|nr:hypothetical protein [Kofleriaceae bacterium]